MPKQYKIKSIIFKSLIPLIFIGIVIAFLTFATYCFKIHLNTITQEAKEAGYKKIENVYIDNIELYADEYNNKYYYIEGNRYQKNTVGDSIKYFIPADIFLENPEDMKNGTPAIIFFKTTTDGKLGTFTLNNELIEVQEAYGIYLNNYIETNAVLSLFKIITIPIAIFISIIIFLSQMLKRKKIKRKSNNPHNLSYGFDWTNPSRL